MLPRFFAPDTSGLDVDVVLPPEEARHLAQVLRLRAGAEVAVFDGRGHEFRARVVSAGRAGVVVRTVERSAVAPEPQIALRLAVAVLKANRLDQVIRDATMLGVAAIQPLVTARTNVPASALRRKGTVERWQRIAIASVKQCGRAVVPAIHPATHLTDFVQTQHPAPSTRHPAPGTLHAAPSVKLGDRLSPDLSTPVGQAFRPATPAAGMSAPVSRGISEARLILVEPSAASDSARTLTTIGTDGRPTAATVLIGPEGGWTEDEIRIAEASGFQPVTLGRLTLRADAVPVVAVTACRVIWNDWSI
jgi:16S rRNA (uracil1498-N3)-methyltransferase